MLHSTLSSITQIDTKDLNVELIVVNNNSNDNTENIVKGFTSSSIPIQYFFEKKPGLAIARNTGVRYAKSKYLIFTDDDILFDKNFLKAIDETFKKTDAMAIGGKIILKYPCKRPGWLSDSIDYMYGKIDLGDKDIPFPQNMSPLGPNMAIKRAAFDQYGKFDENLGLKGGTETILRGEETEFINRLASQGEKIFYSGKSIVYHVIKKERLKKEWFISRFENSGKVVKHSVKKLRFRWWKFSLKYMSALLLSYIFYILKKERLTFYAKCKSKYFFNIIK